MNNVTVESTSVYRYYDTHGILIYVGLTGRGLARNSEHNTSKDWWSLVHRQEVDHLATRLKAQAHEKALIQSFRPPFNTQHNPEVREIRAAYNAFLATAEQGISATEIVTSHGGRLPLEMLNREGTQVTWRTMLADSAVALELRRGAHRRHQEQIVALGGKAFGHVEDLHLRGPLAIIQATVRLGVEIVSAAARVKQMPGKPIQLTLGNIVCDAPALCRDPMAS